MGHGNSDKLYITHAEHAGLTGGAHSSSTGYRAKETGSALQQLPFDCCALSLQPFENPVCVRESDGTGNVFDLLNILPWIKKHGTNPVTGRPLASTDLLKLHYHRNPTTEAYHDPVTFKPFNEHTHIVAIATTGNVFGMDTIDTLCVKTRAWRDLVDDTPFKRADIITLQDPHNIGARSIASFTHIKSTLEAPEEKDSIQGINPSLAKVLKKATGKEMKKTEESEEGEKAFILGPPKPKVGVVAAPRRAAQPYNAAGYTDNAAAASFTSTALDIATKNETALINEEEFMFDTISAPTKEKDRAKMKAYVRIQTNLGGSLNLELHCDRAPKTCYNFLMLARAGKYDNVGFHRLIPGFMIQGGDPTGTGKGGESFWGTPFRDEWDIKGAYKHDSRGVVSMANHGAATNGSQFFITFKPCPHLNGKHTVFGKLVGGEEVLDRMEAVGTRKGSDKPLAAIKMLSVEIFQDPFEEYKSKLKRKLDRQVALAEAKTVAAAEKKDDDKMTWFGTKVGEKDAGLNIGGGGVGKYLKRAAPDSGDLNGEGASAEDGYAKKKKKLGFGDFSSW